MILELTKGEIFELMVSNLTFTYDPFIGNLV